MSFWLLIGRDLKVRYHHWLVKEKFTIFHDRKRDQIINDTRIKYLLVVDKIYEVVNIDFSDLILEAREFDLDVCDVPESEVFCLEDFGEFKVTLRNEHGKVVNFEEWVEGHRKF